MSERGPCRAPRWYRSCFDFSAGARRFLAMLFRPFAAPDGANRKTRTRLRTGGGRVSQYVLHGGDWSLRGDPLRRAGDARRAEPYRMGRGRAARVVRWLRVG